MTIPKRILVVDDDPISRTKLEVLLSAYGVCSVAADGPEAVAVFRRALKGGKPFDLVTMDVEMPGMSGQAAVKRLRDLEEELGGGGEADVVMVTVHKDLKNVSASFWEGCQGYLVKPVSPDGLKRALDKLGLSPETE